MGREYFTRDPGNHAGLGAHALFSLAGSGLELPHPQRPGAVQCHSRFARARPRYRRGTRARSSFARSNRSPATAATPKRSHARSGGRCRCEGAGGRDTPRIPAGSDRRRVEVGPPALVRENVLDPNLILSGTAETPPEASISHFAATAPTRIPFARWKRVGKPR